MRSSPSWRDGSAYLKVNAGGIPGAAVPAGSFAVVELASGATTTFTGSKVVEQVALTATSRPG